MTPTEGLADEIREEVEAEVRSELRTLRRENARLEAELAQVHQSATTAILRLCAAVEAGRGLSERALADTGEAIALAYRAIESAAKLDRERRASPGAAGTTTTTDQEGEPS